MSHEKSEVDFTSFSSALIVGKVDNNDLISNGVGKTSIFRAIEFSLFNQVRDPLLQKDIILEKLIRDEAQKVSITFDFSIDSEVFRLSRSRTRKGISDLSFYKRTAVEKDISAHTAETDKELWEDLSSRRAQDTELDITKKIKMTYKSFCNTSHFMQGDLSGVAMATPEKRKMILKESLDLMVYSKLEEIAKNRANDLIKEMEKNKAILSSIGNPQEELESIKKQLLLAQELHFDKTNGLLIKQASLNSFNEKYAIMSSELNSLESKSSTVISKYAALKDDVSKLDISIAEYSGKRKSIIVTAKKMMNELNELKKMQIDLGIVKEEELMEADKNLNHYKEEINKIRISLATIEAEMRECSIPFPADGTCKHCRQLLTDAHRRVCLKDMEEKLTLLQQDKNKKNIDLVSCQDKVRQYSLAYLELDTKKKKVDEIKLSISSKEEHLIVNKKLHTEFSSLIEGFIVDLNQKKSNLAVAETEVQNSSVKEINELKKQIVFIKEQISKNTSDISLVNQDLTNLQSKIAVFEHSIEQKNNDIKKKSELTKIITDAELEYVIYPDVIQAFSSVGIPNLIIQNVLEDLQAEANNLLTQIKPGLQLSFSTEKTKSNGDLADTLEINYFLNNKARDYSQLSGAQRLCIAFSLKLGLSFLLKNMMDSQIKFLLLDEVDQSLDKAGVDAFAEIIKVFQKDFKILVITHNDQMKSKFSHAILVEQDQNMVSRARVVTSW
jgi:DNA repair exonuclease SbcCD ATPase subunit